MTKNFKKTSLRGDSHIPQAFIEARIVFWKSRKEVRIDRIIKKQILIYNVGEQ